MASATPSSSASPELKKPLFSAAGFASLVEVINGSESDQQHTRRDSNSNKKKKKNEISPAQQLKRMVLSCNLRQHPMSQLERRSSVLETFTNFAPLLEDCVFRETLLPISEDDFAGPNQVPKYYKFQSVDWERGILITISYFESQQKIFVFNHADTWKLMDLETEMSQWYGNFLMRKCVDNTDIVFEIVPRGYYAVYLEHVNIWARCYVQSIMPCNPRECGHPEQKICVILFDYDGSVQVYPRKFFLPLMKSFLDVPVQKIVASLDVATRQHSPWNSHNFAQIRQAVEGKQFHSYILNYNTSTEPFPVLSMGFNMLGEDYDKTSFPSFFKNYFKD